jgi:hypothetical protein
MKYFIIFILIILLLYLVHSTKEKFTNIPFMCNNKTDLLSNNQCLDCSNNSCSFSSSAIPRYDTNSNISKPNLCGPNVNKKCGTGECCSILGECGTDIDHCLTYKRLDDTYDGELDENTKQFQEIRQGKFIPISLNALIQSTNQTTTNLYSNQITSNPTTSNQITSNPISSNQTTSNQTVSNTDYNMDQEEMTKMEVVDKYARKMSQPKPIVCPSYTMDDGKNCVSKVNKYRKTDRLQILGKCSDDEEMITNYMIVKICRRKCDNGDLEIDKNCVSMPKIEIPFEQRLFCNRNQTRINNICYDKCTEGYIENREFCEKLDRKR